MSVEYIIENFSQKQLDNLKMAIECKHNNIFNIKDLSIKNYIFDISLYCENETIKLICELIMKNNITSLEEVKKLIPTIDMAHKRKIYLYDEGFQTEKSTNDFIDEITEKYKNQPNFLLILKFLFDTNRYNVFVKVYNKLMSFEYFWNDTNALNYLSNEVKIIQKYNSTGKLKNKFQFQWNKMHEAMDNINEYINKLEIKYINLEVEEIRKNSINEINNKIKTKIIKKEPIKINVDIVKNKFSDRNHF